MLNAFSKTFPLYFENRFFSPTSKEFSWDGGGTEGLPGICVTSGGMRTLGMVDTCSTRLG
jgi:hypothetical protein